MLSVVIVRHILYTILSVGALNVVMLSVVVMNVVAPVRNVLTKCLYCQTFTASLFNIVVS
jgi:hypothetical protein